MEQINAVVIAVPTGADSDLAHILPNGHKSLVSMNDRPAVSYVVDNLKKCELVSKVVLVSDKAIFDVAANADVFVEASDLNAGVLAGMRAAEGSSKCMIISGDMPLASSEAISDFLTYAPDCDVVYPIVGKADVKAMFPERLAYYVKAKEGQFTGSTCLLFRNDAVSSREELLTRLLNARKNPQSLIGLIGPGIAMKYMLSTLALSEFESGLSRALDLDCRVFISHFPELFISLDSIDDLRLMERALAC